MTARKWAVAPLSSVPVPGYVWAMVKDLPDGYLFRDGERFPLYSSYLKVFTRNAKAAQIPEGFTPHSLRHAFVSALRCEVGCGYLAAPRQLVCSGPGK